MAKTHNRLRLLIENFLAFGAINVLNKIIPLLLLPVITRLLTDTADFGRFDMFNTLVSFGSSLAVLGMYDATFREYFEKDDPLYRKKITSNAFRIVLVSSIILAGIFILFQKYFSLVFLGTKDYGFIVVLAAIGIIFSAWKSIIAAPTRMQNKRKVYVYSGILNSILYYVLAIVLIKLGFSYFGLLFSNLLASLILLVFFFVLNHRHFNIRLSDKKIRSELYKIGIPLVPTFIIYWMFHSMDKIMITNMLGLDQVGIYSVGAKVASISQFLYMAFAGGWQYFAFSTMKDDDYKKMMGRIWEVLLVLSTCFFIIAFLTKNFVFKFLFTGDYRMGVIVFPYLFFAPLLQMLFQVLGTQYHVIKKTYYSPLIFSLGAVFNLIFNYLLIKKIGIEGAAISTMLSYLLVLLLSSYIVIFRLKLINVHPRIIIIVVLFICIFISFFLIDVNMLSITIGLIYCLFILLFYKNDIVNFAKRFTTKNIQN